MSIQKISFALTLLYFSLLLSTLNTSIVASKPEVGFFDIFESNNSSTIKTEIPLTSDQIQIKPISSMNQSSPPVKVSLNYPSTAVTMQNLPTLSSQPDFPIKFYTIKKGDTPSSIAAQYDIPLKELLNANQGIDSSKLQLGQILNLPGKIATAKIKIEAQLSKKMINSADEKLMTNKSSASRQQLNYTKKTVKGTIPAISKSQQTAGKGFISSSFGKRRDPVSNRQKFHKGVDISRPVGTEVFTWSDGVVVQTGWLHGYGLTVDVVHPNGVKTRYAHLKLANVQKGQKLDEGQIIGQVGNTGRTTGANLHFEVIVAGKLTDPLDYLSDNLQIVGSRTTMQKDG